MKKLAVLGIIALLLGALVYTNKGRIYRTAREVLRTHSREKVEAEIEQGGYIWGVDISHHQKSIDWDMLVKQNRPDFIFMKCTEGSTHTDTKYKEYRKEAEKKGLLTGAYHFFSYQSKGADQARNFIKHSNLKRGDLYPVLDIEYMNKTLSNSEVRKQVGAFCKVIKKHYGVNPIIYCEDAYYTNILIKGFKDFDYWISDLQRTPRNDYVFHQYTDKGDVKGIGKIDNNRMKKGLSLDDYTLGDF